MCRHQYESWKFTKSVSFSRQSMACKSLNYWLLSYLQLSDIAFILW